MGSTGKGWRCPWCGVVDKLGRPIAGTALDQIGYPICHDTLHTNSCLTKALRGITRNGVRAGALFHILRYNPLVDLVHRAFPNIYLELADLLYGEQGEPRTQVLLWQWTRVGAWQSYFVDGARTRRGRLMSRYRELLLKVMDGWKRRVAATVVHFLQRQAAVQLPAVRPLQRCHRCEWIGHPFRPQECLECGSRNQLSLVMVRNDEVNRLA